VLSKSVSPGETIVVGFVGGFESPNDDHRGVRRLAVTLSAMPGVRVETFSNHQRRAARTWLKKALDADANGVLDEQERASARVILYGQSWGGAAAINLAQELGKRGIPVLLTVQVDSVGFRDGTVPANVHAAVNFYQHDPLTIQGRTEIKAANPEETHILGNIARSYTGPQPEPAPDSWLRRTFGGSHARMEADPVLWKQVEQYITDAIQSGAARRR